MRVLFFIAFFAINLLVFSQNKAHTNMVKYFDLKKEIAHRKVPRFLSFSIHKNNEELYYFKKAGIIEIYDDSLVFHCLVEKNDKVQYSKKIIRDSAVIKYVNYYFNRFYQYSPNCVHLDFYEGICAPPNISKYAENYSRNEWMITSGQFDEKKGVYEYRFSFKSRLFNFKCLGLFRNLKSRRMFNKLMEYLEGCKPVKAFHSTPTTKWASATMPTAPWLPIHRTITPTTPTAT